MGYTRNVLWGAETYCTIHAGECLHSKRPCDTPGGVVDITYCSNKDHFNKVVGRKIAFTRAVLAFTKDRKLRAELWVGYLRKFPPDGGKECGETFQR